VARNLALLAVLAFLALLGALTVTVAVEEGIDILVVISVIVILLFAFGIVGALVRPPDR
jgi:hypothetical protein